jgi:dTDP-4-amino-4,6-dideoxygalactose transaminase
MTDIQASLGLHQLARLESFIQRRAALAARYTDAFADLAEIVTPVVRPGVFHAWHLYPVRLSAGRLRLDRSAFIAALAERGIGTSVHFIPVHLHPFYRDRFGCGRGDLPVTERVYDEFVSLPLFPSMRDDEVSRVIDTVRALVIDSRA